MDMDEIIIALKFVAIIGVIIGVLVCIVYMLCFTTKWLWKKLFPINWYTRILKYGDDCDCVDAARKLGDVGLKRAIKPLRNALENRQNPVRVRHAIELSLHKLDAIDEPLVDIHLRGLIDSYSVNFYAVQCLGKLGDKKAIKPLLNALSFWGAREEIKNALEHLGVTKEQMINANIQILEGDNWQVKPDAAKDIGQLGDKRAIESLLKVISDEYEPTRRAAKEALQKLGVMKDQLIDAYITALKSKDENVRDDAAMELAIIGDKQVIEPLWQALLDNSSKILIDAIISLNEERGKLVQEVLSKLKQKLPEHKAYSHLKVALKIREEGYDFKIIYEPEQYHYEKVSIPRIDYMAGWDEWEEKIVDKIELLEIAKTVPLNN